MLSNHLLFGSYNCRNPKSFLFSVLWKEIRRNFQENPEPEWSNSGFASRKPSKLFHSGFESNRYTLVRLIRACIIDGEFSHGQQVHCYILKSGHNSNVFVSTSLVSFYVKSELIHDAQKVFDEIPEPNVVSWNSLISGYVQSGQFRRALVLFIQLEKSHLCSDAYSYTAALSACGQLSLEQLGKSIHSKIVKRGVDCDTVVGNTLIDMYGKCGFVTEAMRIYHSLVSKDVISWNSAIAANARNGKIDQAFSILRKMPCPDTISYNELISGIAQFGYMEDALDVLSSMPHPDSSSWNSILTAYVNRSRTREALEFFSKMHLSCVHMDQFTFSSILSGIASVSAITWGRIIHCCTVKFGLDKVIVVGTALIDMYFKCGLMKEAEMLFYRLPKKNLVCWNTMISGYALNGDSDKVTALFKQLTMANHLRPNEITFLNVLSACWKDRLPLKVANQYFQSMIRDYHIDPTSEHCSFMIKLMGLEGEIHNAENMINELGFGSCGSVWRSLLGACVNCGNIEVGQRAAAKVIELEGDNEYAYVLLSNILASHEKWSGVGDIRKLMTQRNIRKEKGYSWIESTALSPYSITS